jgi:ABC-2 type transport system ATP-binding protein
VKLMMGLSTPSGGSVRIFGGDPRRTATRLRTGVMLQVGRAPEMLRVSEHINIFRGYYPNPMAYADIVRGAGLEGVEDRMFGLSHAFIPEPRPSFNGYTPASACQQHHGKIRARCC